MGFYRRSRLWLGVALCALIVTLPACGQQNAPQPSEHLKTWMGRYADLTLPQLLAALQKEQGFQQLPPQIQQRLLDEVKRIYRQEHPQAPEASPAPHVEPAGGGPS